MLWADIKRIKFSAEVGPAVSSVENAILDSFVLVNRKYMVDRLAFERMKKARLSEEMILMACAEEHFAREILNARNIRERSLIYKDAYGDISKIFVTLGQYGQGISDALVALVLPWVSGRRVLEIGCGTGLFAEKIGEKVASYTGIDVSAESINIARERKINNQKVRFSCESITDMRLIPGQYDFIYSNDVFEHLHQEDLSLVLSSCKNALVPGGFIFILTSNRFLGPFDISRNYVPLGTKARCLHINEMSYGELTECLIDHGFVDIQTPLIPLRIFLRLRNIPGADYFFMGKTKIKAYLEQTSWLRKLFSRFTGISSVIIRAKSL